MGAMARPLAPQRARDPPGPPPRNLHSRGRPRAAELLHTWVKVLSEMGYLWDTLGYLGIPWDTLGYLGIPWDTLGYLGIPWDPDMTQINVQISDFYERLHQQS